MTTFFDKARGRDVIVTPEEDVRQNFIKYLVDELGYPHNVMRIERKIINEMQEGIRRPDIVIYNKHGLPCVVVECKAKGVKVCEDTALQVMNYNKHICAEYIIITNGRETYCWRLVENKYIASNIPRFDSL